jgi:hypothetical protein
MFCGIINLESRVKNYLTVVMENINKWLTISPGKKGKGDVINAKG